MSHSQQNQHDNAEPCSQDYTHGGNNGTYGHKEDSSFFKTVYCLRTKQTTSKYIWHQHLTVLQADPSFQNPKKTCTSECPINSAGAHEEPGHFVEEEVNSTLSCSPQAAPPEPRGPGPAPSFPFMRPRAHFPWEGWWLGTGCVSHSSSRVRPMPCLDLRVPGKEAAGSWLRLTLECHGRAEFKPQRLMCCTEE